MRSDVFKIDSDTATILDATEKFGKICELPDEDARTLRLLAQEMLSMTERLLDAYGFSYYVENADKLFSLHLTVNAAVNLTEKDMLLSVSKTGKNEATKGIWGKISGLFESMIMGEQEFPMATAISMPDSDMSYISPVPLFDPAELPHQEDWNGVEKCIIDSLADDVLIGVRSNEAELLVKIDFSKDIDRKIRC